MVIEIPDGLCQVCVGLASCHPVAYDGHYFVEVYGEELPVNRHTRIKDIHVYENAILPQYPANFTEIVIDIFQVPCQKGRYNPVSRFIGQGYFFCTCYNKPCARKHFWPEHGVCHIQAGSPACSARFYDLPG